jgi:hypothetical protein
VVLVEGGRFCADGVDHDESGCGDVGGCSSSGERRAVWPDVLAEFRWQSSCGSSYRCVAA